jgi:crotonobetainyl-CoA:carnitine CoA-transferase CaiB-like acyl-CoA transferase
MNATLRAAELVNTVAEAPLTGLIVADLSRVLAGPLAASALADLGATVIKVERPGAGDETRSWGPPWAGKTSSYFESANRSKLAMTLDFGVADDRELAQQLCRRADIIIENYRSGTLARYDLDYPTVARTNPKVVYCSITGFGAHAGAGRPGYDFVVQAAGGLMSITGDPTADPTKVGVALVDVLTSKDAVSGILAALLARERDGLGQLVEVNLMSSLLSGLVNQASGWMASGQPPSRLGNRHPSIAPYETFRCRDGSIAVACGNNGQFVRLVETLASPELATDDRFATNSARVRHRQALVDALEAGLAKRSAADWEEALLARDVPCARVRDIGEAFALADELGLSPTMRIEGSEIPQVRHPVEFGRTPTTIPAAPPDLGAHDAELRRWLSGDSAHPLPTGRPSL